MKATVTVMQYDKTLQAWNGAATLEWSPSPRNPNGAIQRIFFDYGDDGKYNWFPFDESFQVTERQAAFLMDAIKRKAQEELLLEGLFED